MIAAIVLPVAPARAGVVTDGSKLVHVWTVNLHQSENNDKFVTAVDTYTYKPDIILAQEITTNSITRTSPPNFIDKLKNTLGPTYDYRMVCEYLCNLSGEVSDAIFYRVSRFTSPAKVTWPSFELVNGSCQQTGPDGQIRHDDEIAVKFTDSVVGKTIVAASVHWDRESDVCIEQNMKKAENKIATLAPSRPMSILGGDFNSHPASQFVPEDYWASGYETNPDCWWRLFNAGSADNLTCTAADAVDTWHDTVKLYAPDICNEWTHGHGSAKQGTSCTHVDAADGSTDNRDRSRVDLLWARWIKADGSVLTDPVAAKSMIVDAGADRQATPDAADGQKYSDHRAVHAVLKW